MPHNVVFLDNEPSEKEYFEEYSRYITLLNSWFVLMFVLRCFAPFCLGLQTGPFEHLESVELYITEFSIDFNATHDNGSEEALMRQWKITSTPPLEKQVIMEMTMLKSIGFTIGAVLGGICSDIFGRRVVGVIVSVVWISLSVIFTILRSKVTVEIFYVFLTACSSMVNVITFVNCSSVSEIANNKWRLLAVYSLPCYVLGDFLIPFIVKSLSVWRYSLTFITTTFSCLIFTTWYTPESPRWLLNKNKKQEAYKQLDHISGLVYNIIQIEERTGNIPLKKVAIDMFRFLFSNRLKQFVICNILIAISSIHYSCQKLLVILRHVYVNELQGIENIAESLGFLCFIPIYLLLGKRNGLFFCFILLALQNVIAVVIGNRRTDIYINLFSVMIGITSVNFCWLYFLDVFPTFVRATVTGIGFGVFNVSVGTTTYLISNIEQFRGFPYRMVSLIACFFGVTVLKLPSDNYNQDLPNFKLHR